MKAIMYEETGPSSVLKLRDRAAAAPGPGEVRVRLVVSGVDTVVDLTVPIPESMAKNILPIGKC